ncbi:hypothetical protein B0T13DRAFT_456781 [Neurospora crassa]|nr:hypothetical protein B0T13DRAFT_456781 [Neurospora crassa]
MLGFLLQSVFAFLLRQVPSRPRSSILFLTERERLQAAVLLECSFLGFIAVWYFVRKGHLTVKIFPYYEKEVLS